MTESDPSPELTSFLGEKMSSFWTTHIGDSTKDSESKRLAIAVWVCVSLRSGCDVRESNDVQISKGLIVRNHPQLSFFVDKLFELFEEDDVSWDAARAIGQIVAINKVLTKSTHAVLKVG